MKRQGDLLIIPVSEIPVDAKKQESLVLAEGEATGHRHELNYGEVYQKKDQLYFTVIEGMEVTLKHPEHDPLIFTPGKYKVVRQKEYEPGSWRYVAD